MVDIKSATAEIRRGKNQEEETGQKYNVRVCFTHGGHNKRRIYCTGAMPVIINVAWWRYSTGDLELADSIRALSAVMQQP